MRRLTCAFTVFAGLLLTAACAAPVQVQTAAATQRPPTPVDTSLPPGVCAAFSMSLAPNVVGQASPMEAVQWFLARGEDPGYPSSGWQTVGPDEMGVSVASGGATLHVVQLPNQTWMVNEGRRC